MALSAVHTNRVVQDLRGRDLIRWERDLVTIRDWDGLAELGEFDPTYLRMPKNSAPHPAGV
jgi:hypothetical protein